MWIKVDVYARGGRRHLDYVHDYGTFEDFPFRLMLGEFRKYYAPLVADFPDSPMRFEAQQKVQGL